MLAPWKKSYDKPQQHIKAKKHSFANKGQSFAIKAMIFPVVMYACENWIIKNAEHRRTDASNSGAGKDS